MGQTGVGPGHSTAAALREAAEPGKPETAEEGRQTAADMRAEHKADGRSLDGSYWWKLGQGRVEDDSTEAEEAHSCLLEDRELHKKQEEGGEGMAVRCILDWEEGLDTQVGGFDSGHLDHDH